jgi:hypothetical protein
MAGDWERFRWTLPEWSARRDSVGTVPVSVAANTSRFAVISSNVSISVITAVFEKHMVYLTLTGVLLPTRTTVGVIMFWAHLVHCSDKAEGGGSNFFAYSRNRSTQRWERLYRIRPCGVRSDTGADDEARYVPSFLRCHYRILSVNCCMAIHQDRDTGRSGSERADVGSPARRAFHRWKKAVWVGAAEEARNSDQLVSVHGPSSYLPESVKAKDATATTVAWRDGLVAFGDVVARFEIHLLFHLH